MSVKNKRPYKEDGNSTYTYNKKKRERRKQGQVERKQTRTDTKQIKKNGIQEENRGECKLGFRKFKRDRKGTKREEEWIGKERDDTI